MKGNWKSDRLIQEISVEKVTGFGALGPGQVQGRVSGGQNDISFRKVNTVGNPY